MRKSSSQSERENSEPLEPRSRSYWRARIRDALPGLSIDWLADGPIHARVNTWHFANAGIVEIKDPPIQVSRRVQPGSMDRGYKLALHLAGHGHYRCPDNEFTQAPGDLVLLDTEMPFEVVHPAGTHVLIWELSRSDLGCLLGRPEGCRLIRGSDGIGPILGGYMQMLASEAERLPVTAQLNLHTHLCTLVALALGSAPAVAEEQHQIARRAVQRQRIFAYIESHLSDPAITAERAARDMRMSRRWLYALLNGSGENFAERMTRRRLEECYKLLNSPTHDHLSVADIVLRMGFGDVSTFYRRFRRQYGTTPRDVREAARLCRQRCEKVELHLDKRVKG